MPGQQAARTTAAAKHRDGRPEGALRRLPQGGLQSAPPRGNHAPPPARDRGGPLLPRSAGPAAVTRARA